MALLSQDRKVTGTLGAAQDTVKVYSAGLATVTFQIAAGLTGTVTFEATDDDAASPTLKVIPATNISTDARATTAVNPNGIYRVNSAGLRMVQARVSAYSSGSAAVIANGSNVSFSDPAAVAGGGGGGGGAVTVADGADVAQGTTTDAGIITDTSGTVIGFLRGAIKMWLNFLARIPAALTGSGNFKVSVAESTATVTADTELPAAAALSDATANPTAPMVGAALMGWDGATWERNVLIAGADAKNNALVSIITSAWGYIFNGTTWDRLRGTTNGLFAHGSIAHDGVDAGNPLKVGARAIAHGANPTAVAAADRTDLFANRHGVLFVMSGHPNTQTVRANYTAAQTNTAIVTVATGLKIVVTRVTVAASKANTVNTSVVIGFATATTPTTTGVVAAHPNIDPGGGFSTGSGGGILGVGADDEDLRITSSVPTGGSIDVLVSYHTIES